MLTRRVTKTVRYVAVRQQMLHLQQTVLPHMNVPAIIITYMAYEEACLARDKQGILQAVLQPRQLNSQMTPTNQQAATKQLWTGQATVPHVVTLAESCT